MSLNIQGLKGDASMSVNNSRVKCENEKIRVDS